MKSDLNTFFSISRQIFGVCPKTRQIFRLSDCKIYLKTSPQKDWMDKLQDKEESITTREEKLDEKKNEMQEAARIKGRKAADKVIKKIDKVFSGRGLNPDDSRVIFHPVNFVVFDGMKDKEIDKIILLDEETKDSERKVLQKSIEKVIEKGLYEWETLRVTDAGGIAMDAKKSKGE